MFPSGETQSQHVFLPPYPRSTSPAAPGLHGEDRGRSTSLLAPDSRQGRSGSARGSAGSHSQTRRGRSLSPGRGKKDLSYTACRKMMVEGDLADEMRAKIGEGDIVDVNELAFFGHSGSDGQVCVCGGRTGD